MVFNIERQHNARKRFPKKYANIVYTMFLYKIFNAAVKIVNAAAKIVNGAAKIGNTLLFGSLVAKGCRIIFQVW